MNKSMKLSCVLVASLLLFTAGLQFIMASVTGNTGRVHEPLKKLNLVVPGWESKDLPIAKTEFLLKKTEEILQYDDYRYVEYTKGGVKVALYIAYWGKGKISPKEISWHNPDICWVGNGFERIEAKSRVDRVLNGVTLRQAEERTYLANGSRLFVAFFHLVGGRLRSVNLSGKDPWYAFFNDIRQQGLNIKNEQFFVRLSSTVSIDEVLSDPAMASFWVSINEIH
jgi:hypothetical protein